MPLMVLPFGIWPICHHSMQCRQRMSPRDPPNMWPDCIDSHYNVQICGLLMRQEEKWSKLTIIKRDRTGDQEWREVSCCECPALPSGVMVRSQLELPLRMVSGFMTIQWLGLILVFEVYVTTRELNLGMYLGRPGAWDHMDFQRLCRTGPSPHWLWCCFGELTLLLTWAAAVRRVGLVLIPGSKMKLTMVGKGHVRGHECGTADCTSLESCPQGS